MTKRRWLLGLALFLAAGVGFLVASPTEAQSRRPWPRPRPAVSAALVDHEGSRLRTFLHGGRTFVLGEQGRRYSIVVRNPTDRRVEAVVSVDGRDVISGRRADLERDRGYVVPARGSVTIDGFRTSLDDVATFRFVDPGESFSARMGTPENVGVVGVAVFEERREAPVEIARHDRPLPKRTRGAPGAPPAPSEPSAANRSRADRQSETNLGTEFGEARMSRVMEVSFVRASMRPARVLEIHYDDARGLEARGIDVFGDRPVRSGPVAFPGRFAAPLGGR